MFYFFQGRLLRVRSLSLCLLTLALAGCGGLLSGMGERFAGNLSASMADNDDPALVEAGAASYILLADALVRQDPESPAFRMAAASLNSAYAGAFVKDPKRASALTDKALRYATEAACLAHDTLCRLRDMPLDELKTHIAALDDREDDVPLLFTVGSVWAGWIQAHSDDFNAVADLSRVEVIMQRVIALDETYQHGMAHLYLGVIATAIPPALGGRPEVGREHFEKAMALSQGHNFMVQVYYAKNYARGVFDRELHDRLLNEVLAADPHQTGWTLSNIKAQEEARALLASADDYF